MEFVYFPSFSEYISDFNYLIAYFCLLVNLLYILEKSNMTIPKIQIFAIVGLLILQNNTFSRSDSKFSDIGYNLSVEVLLDSLESNFKNVDNTRTFAEKAYNLSVESDNEKGKAVSLFYLGRYWYYKNDFDTAYRLLTSALPFIENNRSDYPEIYLRSLFYLGTIKYYLGDNGKALFFYGKGLIYSEELNDPDWKVNFLSQLGGCYIQLENYNTAFDLFSKAAIICDSLENIRLLANVYMQIANIQTELKEYDSAIRYFEIAKPYIEKDNTLENWAVYYSNTGHLYGMMKQYDKALSNFKEALKYDIELDDKYAISLDLSNIGDIYRDMKQTDSAKYYLYKALELATKIKHLEIISTVYYNLGMLEQENGNYSGAVDFANKCLSVSKKSKNTKQILDGCKLLYTNLANIQDYKQAYNWELYYQKIQDSLVNIEKEKVKESLLAKYKQEREIQAFKEKSNYEQKLRKYLIIIVAMGLLLSVFLFLLYYSKNKTTRKLKRQKNFFNTLSESSEDIVFVIDENCKLKYISPSYERKIGRSKDERIDGKAPDFIHPEDIPILKGILKKAREDKDVHSFEFRLKKADGTWIYVAATGKNCLDNPDINGFIVNVWDITERKNNEKKLIESEQSYRDLFNNASDAIFVHTSEGVILDVNKGAENMLGYSRETFIGKMPVFLGAEGMNDVNFLMKNVKRAFYGSPTQFEFWAKRKSGEVFPMLVRVNNSTFFGKNVLITFAIDISERKEAERKLRKSEENYRRIFNAFPDIYFKSDSTGKIVEVSPSVEKIAGYKREELLGKNSIEFYEDNEEWEKIGELLYHNKRINDIDIKVKTKEGKTLYCSLSASLILDEEGNVLGLDGVIRDISERARINKLLRKSESKLSEANKAKEILLSVIGHDIKGPIGTNKAMTDLIIRDGHRISKEKIIEIVESIKPTIDSTYNMVENLVTWSKVQRNKLELEIKPGYIKPIVDEVFSLFSYHAKTKEIELLFEGNEMQTALFDKNQVTAIVRNIVSNAIKFTKHGGKVIVSLSEDYNYTLIKVMDTGIGMPQTQIDKILSNSLDIDLSYGTENEKGTGLGLNLVLDFIKLNDGKININSKVNEGTEITIFLKKIEVL